MAVSVQVLYPTEGGSTFDHDYYQSQHMALVGEHMGPHIQSTVVTKGSDTPEGPAPYHAIATIVFADAAAREAALAAAGPVLADIPKFTNSAPQMLMGDVT